MVRELRAAQDCAEGGAKTVVAFGEQTRDVNIVKSRHHEARQPHPYTATKRL